VFYDRQHWAKLTSVMSDASFKPYETYHGFLWLHLKRTYLVHVKMKNTKKIKVQIHG
jgi:hypothetical protein